MSSTSKGSSSQPIEVTVANSYSFLIIDTYYPRFLRSLYASNPSLTTTGYVEQHSFLMDQCFGTADFYSANLNKIGCHAEEIIPNNEILQRQWAIEHGVRIEEPLYAKAIKRVPYVRRYIRTHNWLLNILAEQIKKAKPDVLYLQDLSFCPPDFLKEMKRYVRLVVGQIACPLPPLDNLRSLDLILTSFPHYVERFRSMGIKSEYFKIAFDPSVLEKTGKVDRKYNCTFVGGIGPAHRSGTLLLEELARRVEIDFFGYGADTLDASSPIHARHHGEVWGLDMYRTLLASKITINRHIDVAENNANNMRLYEATGCGALLITDNKINLNDLFKVGKEVVAYGNIDDLISQINYYSSRQSELETIAHAGQTRTMNEHTYQQRMEQLLGIINTYADQLA